MYAKTKRYLLAVSHIFTGKSPFAQASICAIIVGVATLLSISTDLYWLIGDMRHNILQHHIYVFIGLTISLIITAMSFYWLVKSLKMWEKRVHELETRSLEHNRDLTPKHCNATPKKSTYKKGDYKYIDVTD